MWSAPPHQGRVRAISGSRATVSTRKVVLSVPQIIARVRDDYKADFIHILNPEHHHRVSETFKEEMKVNEYLHGLVQLAFQAPDLEKFLRSFPKHGRKIRVKEINGRQFAFGKRGKVPLGQIDARGNIVGTSGEILYYEGDYKIIQREYSNV